jgi:hypothetical protein
LTSLWNEQVEGSTTPDVWNAALGHFAEAAPLTSSKPSVKPSKSNLRTQIEKTDLFIAGQTY